MTDLLSGRRRGGATAEPSRPRTRAAAPRKPLARGPESLSRRRRAAPASAQGQVGRAGRPHLKDRRTCSGSERPAPRVSLTRARVPGAALLLRARWEKARGGARRGPRRLVPVRPSQSQDGGFLTGPLHRVPRVVICRLQSLQLRRRELSRASRNPPLSVCSRGGDPSTVSSGNTSSHALRAGRC